MIGWNVKRVNPFKRFLPLTILAGLFVLSSPLSWAEIITVQGEMSTSVTAYLTRRFSSYSEAKNLTYRMYLPDSQTEGLYTQNISRLRKTFNPFPTETKEFVDEYGNRGIELIWNKEIRVIQTDLQFSAQVFSNFYTIDSTAPYPTSNDERLNLFIASTELAPANDFMINYVGRSLAYGLDREVDVVKNTLLWLDEHIDLARDTETEKDYDALSVLKMKKGNERGICNLTVSIFKGLGIPARVVYGLSFQKEITIITEQDRYLYDYANDEKLWVEVYFPDLGWIAYDPVGTHFGTVSHVIKFSIGPDSDFAVDRWEIELGDVIEFKEFIFDVKNDLVKLDIQGFDPEEKSRIIISAPIQGFNPSTKKPELDVGREAAAEEEAPPQETGDKAVIGQNSDISRPLDVVATQNRVYAQRFNLEHPCILTEIQLPLIKFSDEGRIWLEVYSDDGGKPGKVLFKTYSIHSLRVRFMMMDNPWLSFPVGSKTDSYLEEGYYWIALRSSGNCIFNWYAACGNVFGISSDTRYKDVSLKSPDWDSVLNYDMNFRILGNRKAVD
jgi:transglutaminase-like putative cysteine protease